jgi:hypothetical protein
MEALQLEILNPKALQILEGMQNLKLIKVSNKKSAAKEYLQKKRKTTAPSLMEITKIVEEVRASRYAKK